MSTIAYDSKIGPKVPLSQLLIPAVGVLLSALTEAPRGVLHALGAIGLVGPGLDGSTGVIAAFWASQIALVLVGACTEKLWLRYGMFVAILIAGIASILG
jgi:hypothetical protein